MPSCRDCSFKAKSAGGLASHVRACKTKEAVRNHANDVDEPVEMGGGVCTDCHTLPAGSVELVSLLLVLVFSLSAVLVTSVYALNQQSHELSQLQAEVAVEVDEVE